MTQLAVDHLLFEYDPNKWDFLQYDNSSSYKKGISRLQGSKAVDLVVIDKKKERLYLIELKDFSGDRTIEHKGRIQKELPEEVALKVRDTIAGLIGFAHKGEHNSSWARLLVDADTPIYVVLMVELNENIKMGESHIRQCNKRKKTPHQILSDKIKEELAWLKPRCLAMNLQGVDSLFEGVTASRTQRDLRQRTDP